MITAPQTFDPNASPDQRVLAVKKLITGLKQSTRPILLGPWRSELGFEVLYWIPFLRWISRQVPNFDARACVVTRGGLAPLYSQVASKGHDLYALREVADVRRANLADYRKTAMQKQLGLTEWDTRALDDVAKAMGMGPVYDQIHPSWMYWALAPYWDGHVGLSYLSRLVTFEPLPKPPRATNLPPAYVAAKFYGRATFPYPEPEVTAFISQIAGVLAAQTPVVAIAGDGAYDDHTDVPLQGPNVILVSPNTPATNLLEQACVIAHATAVVGTYGGAMQMALRMGVPSVSFWKDFGGTSSSHLFLSQHLSTQTSVPFVTSSMRDLWLTQQCIMVPPLQQIQASMAPV